jgi:hypothetical protein
VEEALQPGLWQFAGYPCKSCISGAAECPRPETADRPRQGPDRATESALAGGKRLCHPLPPSNGAFGTAWKHVPHAQGMSDRMRHRRPARRRQAGPELQKRMGRPVQPPDPMKRGRWHADSPQPSSRRRWFNHGTSPTPRNHAAERVGAGERIPEVTTRAARPIGHHASRPLEFRVKPRA